MSNDIMMLDPFKNTNLCGVFWNLLKELNLDRDDI